MRQPVEQALTDELLEGRYRVVRRIATGGMATVYVAEHALIGRQVAIKVLHPQYADDAACVQRFLAEGRTAGTLGHPNIVESTDMGYTATGAPFLVLELLEGCNLQELVGRERRLAIARAVNIAQQIASALAAAHARGIIHRDLKSGNVFLVDRGAEGELVKVLDFGISKFMEGRANTQKDVLLGTPWFMAPEQINDPSSVDERCDVYGLGVILYEMLTGDVPFADTPYPKLFGRILSEEPVAIEVLRPDVSPELAAVVKRAMAKSLDARAQSMDEVGRALAALSGRAFPEPVARGAMRTPGAGEMPSSAATRLITPVPRGTPATRAWRPARPAGRPASGPPASERPASEPLASGRPPTGPLALPPPPRPETGPAATPAWPRRRVAGVAAVGATAVAVAVALWAGLASGRAAGAGGQGTPANTAVAGSAPSTATAGGAASTRPADTAPAGVALAAAQGARGAGDGSAAATGAGAGTEVLREPSGEAVSNDAGPSGRAPQSPAADPVSDQVALAVTSSARGARVTFRGESHRLPFKRRLARGAQPELVEVGVPGRWVKRSWITLDRDQALSVHPDRPARGEAARGSSSPSSADPDPVDETVAEEAPQGEPEPPAPRETARAAPVREPRPEPAAAPPRRTAATRAPDTAAPGTMDPQATQRAVNRHLGELRTCFERGRMDNPQLAGRVLVRITVAPTGAVSGAHIARSTLGSQTVESCIVSIVNTWTLPAPSGGVAATITYPFSFQ